MAGELHGMLMDKGVFYGTLDSIKDAEPGIYGVYERSVSDWSQKFGTLIVWKSRSTNYKGWMLMDLGGHNIVYGGSSGYRILDI